MSQQAYTMSAISNKVDTLQVYIFLMCFNEAVLLPHTVAHYKTRFPECIITIYDNESTDDSVAIATMLGCRIVSFSTNLLDDFKIKNIKNTCWTEILNGWVIVADMDEWLDVFQEDLMHENLRGTTVLSTVGLQMFGRSHCKNLSDIDLSKINRFYVDPMYSKSIAFRRPQIQSMNYCIGAHNCVPSGVVKKSSRLYTLKHMNYLGLPYFIEKNMIRFERAVFMRIKGAATHYAQRKDEIAIKFEEAEKKADRDGPF